MTTKNRADRTHNDPIDKISNHEVTTPPLPAWISEAAARYIHRHATGPDDEHLLLDALGLTPTT